jgi:hypothetical protein
MATSSPPSPPPEIKEVPATPNDPVSHAAANADAYVKTGKTGGKRFHVTIHVAGRPTLIAIHL